MGILAAIILTSLGNGPERARQERVNNELPNIANAVKLYVNTNNDYPPDAGEAGIPSVVTKYIADTNSAGNLPNGPWPGSKYDYDAWDLYPVDGVTDTIQVSLRFCTYAEYSGAGGPALCKARMPRETWAANFTSNNNAYYYCIKGYCRANSAVPLGTAGYCLNCSNHSPIAKPDGT